jgi:hypothetical protein
MHPAPAHAPFKVRTSCANFLRASTHFLRDADWPEPVGQASGAMDLLAARAGSPERPDGNPFSAVSTDEVDNFLISARPSKARSCSDLHH